MVERLHAVLDPLDPADGVACFTRMYLRVTELVRDRVREGEFEDPAFVARLDAVFAGIFLAAAELPPDRTERRSRAWRPLFDLRGAADVEGIQFAVAGMNTHINHDLSVALVRTCRQLGRRPDEAVVRRDYDHVNVLLASVEREVRQSYLDGVALRADREVAPVLDLLGAWSISRARDAAYASALVQWRLQRDAGLLADYVATQDGTVGLVTRHLLTPVVVRV